MVILKWRRNLKNKKCIVLSYVLLDIHKDKVKVIFCVATAAGWCCLLGIRWLILSIPVKVVTEGSHLHSHKWASRSERNARYCHLRTDVAVRLWRGLLELHWEYKVCSLSVDLTPALLYCLSSLCSKEWQYTLPLRCATDTRLNKSAYENEKGRECRSLKRALCIGATRRWLFLVFRVEKSPFECLIHLSLICHPLWIIFLQRRSCVFPLGRSMTGWLALRQSLFVFISTICTVCVCVCACMHILYICMPYHPSVNVLFHLMVK